MSHDEQLVSRFYRHLTHWFIFRQSVAAVTAWTFLWGTAILVLKVTQGTSALPLLLGAIGIPLAIGLAAWIAVRRLPDLSAVRAMLDGRCERGGLLMASAECDLGQWKPKRTIDSMPKLQWDGRRAFGFLAVAVAYVVLGFLLPASSLAASRPPLDVDRPAQRLTEQVRVLQEEKILDPKRAEDMKQKIEELRSQSSGKDPAQTLEALDHLNDVVHQAAAQAAETKARQANQLGKIEAAAEALKKVAPMLSPKDAADLMKELATMAQKAAAENEALQEELGPELAEALKEGKLTADQLAKLAAAAENAQGDLSRSGENLHNAKLIDSDQLKAIEGEGGKPDTEALADYLKKSGLKKRTLQEGLENQGGNPGDDDDDDDDESGFTPLNFGDRSNAEGAKFKEEALPPAQLAALKESQLTGIAKAPPSRDPKAGPPQAGSLTGAATGGGSANAAPVLPQHRGAVDRYFERPAK